ncbi:MAG: SufD family Fe-S cluster assembly protein [Nanoarchaeota archaeon]
MNYLFSASGVPIIAYESSEFKKFRMNQFEKMKASPKLNFRYGLNTIIQPKNFSFEQLEHHSKMPFKRVIRCSDDRVLILSGKELFKHSEAKKLLELFLEKRSGNGDVLDYATEAFTHDVLLMKIPCDCITKEPIFINYDYFADSRNLIFILAEAGSQTKIFITKYSSGMSTFIADKIVLIAEENSRVDFVNVQQLQHHIIGVQKQEAFCKKDARVAWSDICLGSEYMRSSLISILEEEGSSTKLNVLYVGRKQQHFDLYTAAIHAAAHTNSESMTKGVLEEEAKALSRGLVRIEKNAAGSNGYEKQEALLFSELAEAHAIPTLEINNHNVKCGHGSSVGQIDPEILFYMMSRGLNKASAQKKIVEGYFAPLIASFDKKIQEKINALIQ